MRLPDKGLIDRSKPVTFRFDGRSYGGFAGDSLASALLANGVKREAAGGMLAKWRKSRAASPEPDGCEPSVFAEQITAYLKEAAAERAQPADALLDHRTAPAPARAPSSQTSAH